MQKRSKLLDGILKYTVAAIIIAVPLYPKFPFLRIPGTFVSIRLEDLLMVFSGILVIIFYFPRIRELLRVKLFRYVFIFLLVGLVSTLAGIFITKTVTFHIGLLHWARRVEYFIPLFLGIESVRRDRSNLEFYFKVLLITLLVIFVYGFGQKHFAWPIIITQNEEYSKGVALRWMSGSHINSTFAGHYDLATFLVLILPVIVTSLVLFKRFKDRILIGISGFAGLWLLVNTASRISLVAYFIAVCLALIIIKKYKLILLVLIVSIIFVATSSNLLDRYLRILEFVKIKTLQVSQLNYPLRLVYAAEEDSLVRLRTTVLTPTPEQIFEDRSTNIRLNVEWPRAIRAFSKNPLLGTGYSSITLATDNDFFRLLGEIGILGFLAFLLILIELGLTLVKGTSVLLNKDALTKAFLAGTTGALPGLLTNALFIDIFEASKFALIFWLFMGFVVGMVKYE